MALCPWCTHVLLYLRNLQTFAHIDVPGRPISLISSIDRPLTAQIEAHTCVVLAARATQQLSLASDATFLVTSTRFHGLPEIVQCALQRSALPSLRLTPCLDGERRRRLRRARSIQTRIPWTLNWFKMEDTSSKMFLGKAKLGRMMVIMRYLLDDNRQFQASHQPK